MKKLILIPVLALVACVGEPKTIIKEVPVEVEVPVSVPCMGEKPEEVTSLRDQLSRDEWDSLTTDQRENLLAVQALMRKVFGDRLTAASAGCR